MFKEKVQKLVFKCKDIILNIKKLVALKFTQPKRRLF